MISEDDITKAIEMGNKERERIKNEETRTSFGRFDFYDQRFDMFNQLLNVYEQYNVSGGSLHIYLEDGNKGVGNIEFCKKYALENGDLIGAHLCNELLYFGEEFINNLIDEDIHLAWAVWKSRKEKDN